MKLLCELNDQNVLGLPGRSAAQPRRTARAIVQRADGLYAVMYAAKYNLYSLPGGGIESDEDVLTALQREILEETGCTCDQVEELGIIEENRASLDYTQINYYYLVSTTHIPANTRLTPAEQNSGTQVQWHSLEDMVSLITNQSFDRVQGKYLHARDVAALRAWLNKM